MGFIIIIWFCPPHIDRLRARLEIKMIVEVSRTRAIIKISDLPTDPLVDRAHRRVMISKLVMGFVPGAVVAVCTLAFAATRVSPLEALAVLLPAARSRTSAYSILWFSIIGAVVDEVKAVQALTRWPTDFPIGKTIAILDCAFRFGASAFDNAALMKPAGFHV